VRESQYVYMYQGLVEEPLVGKKQDNRLIRLCNEAQNRRIPRRNLVP
jgi:hypothetical protein